MNRASCAAILMSLHGQQALYGEATRVLVDLPDTRYDRIAESFGLHAERIGKPEEIGPAMRRARDSGGPALLDLAIAPEVVHPMMQQMLQPVPEGHTRVPYYETIPPARRETGLLTMKAAVVNHAQGLDIV
jgi:acetolactate synthase-1/2/3 large subunit